MKPLPSSDIRSNVGTWAVPNCFLPAIAGKMLDALKPEVFDPDFKGQYLQTTYFDTPDWDLRKARVTKGQYLTLRIRCYAPAKGYGNAFGGGTYAFSAKTEDQKFRIEISDDQADLYLSQGITSSSLASILPPDLFARYLMLAGDETLLPIVTVCFNRYAAEDKINRLTLDCCIYTDTGKQFPTNVLEHKSTNDEQPSLVADCPIRPIKMSKFLWATGP